jgi:Zn finger protein HypA/HybF involved in hydrogenase expression
MTTDEILKIVKDAWDEHISSEAYESILGIGSTITGKTEFLLDIKEKLEKNNKPPSAGTIICLECNETFNIEEDDDCYDMDCPSCGSTDLDLNFVFSSDREPNKDWEE